jgi:hypothetical protein
MSNVPEMQLNVLKWYIYGPGKFFFNITIWLNAKKILCLAY